MEVRLIKADITRIKCSNKKEKYLIEQLKVAGIEVIKESSMYTYFKFNGDIAAAMECLGYK